MGTLLRYELKKLLSRKLVWILLAVSLAALAFYNWPILQAGTNGEARGLRNIYKQYEGRVVTDAFKQEVRQAYDKYVAAHPGSFEINNWEGEDYYFSNDEGYHTGVWRAYEEIIGTQSVEAQEKSLNEIKDLLKSGVHDDGRPLEFYSRERYEVMARNGITTPVIRYAWGWKHLYGMDTIVPGVLLLFILGFGLLPVFYAERTARMEGMTLCARSQSKMAAAKLLAASCFTVGVALLFYGFNVAVAAVVYGLDGASLPQTAINYWDGSTGAWTLGASYALSSLAIVLAALACAALVCISSTLFRHPLLSLLCASVSIALQIVAADTLSHSLLQMSSPFWYQLNDYFAKLPAMTLVHQYIGSMAQANNAVFLIACPALIIALCCWLAPRLFLRRRKA